MSGPPPEARLLREYRERQGLSIREAARRADVSEGSWRGYESSRRAVRRMPHTLAVMARVVGISDADLQRASRHDAAAELAALPPLPAEPVSQEELLRQMQERLDELERGFRSLQRPARESDDDEEDHANVAHG